MRFNEWRSTEIIQRLEGFQTVLPSQKAFIDGQRWSEMVRDGRRVKHKDRWLIAHEQGQALSLC